MIKARKIIINEILYHWSITPDKNSNIVKIWIASTGKIIYEGNTDKNLNITPKHIIDIINTET